MAVTVAVAWKVSTNVVLVSDLTTALLCSTGIEVEHAERIRNNTGSKARAKSSRCFVFMCLFVTELLDRR
jgi:hypothetical protein